MEKVFRLFNWFSLIRMNKIFLILFLFLKINIYSQDFSFLGLEIGMSHNQVLSTIGNTSIIIPAEDNLLKQLIPPTPYTLVLKGNNTNNIMINRILLDFYQQKTYQITIFLNPIYFSFYTLSEKLLDKYGTSTNRSSIKVTWYDQDLNYRLTLENPATIKITDYNILQNVLEFQSNQIEQGISESADYKNREYILNEL